ncbi:sialidase family protein [Aeoliella mucimassa]|uniref:BNR/Asp-box repeat protein n=1 Tax=Aeoliella mucimassa TaxID=2527972 RepID=A0A518AIJ6_9BACT|nr:sialidase family protein [Aeoliella mucimassa]QDU54552.1 BNR/Asp-box repeat protein [Aeoliella mucimassa]
MNGKVVNSRRRHLTIFCRTLLLVTLAANLHALTVAQAADRLTEAINQHPPAIPIASGFEIPSEGYCDQPYVVKLPDGTWLCTMTTGEGHEGNKGQHVVSTRSTDRGRTWGPLVDIEPAAGPEASWAMPYLTSYGRVYAFYIYNAKNMREVIAGTDYARQRVDTLGEYAVKYSDDGGKSWSAERYYIPVRMTAIDRRNPYQGEVRFQWGVGKPIRHKNAMIFGFTKIEKFGAGFIERSESFFIRCSNIETERDPDKLNWQTLPEGETGLKSPEGPIASEVNLTSLSDGSLFCTYRTVAGHPCHAYSRNDGRTWTPPAFMTYGPSGQLVDHPRAANFVRKLTKGPYAGRYIYWFHNHSGKDYAGRNPAYLLGGVEVDTPRGKVIEWGQPVAVLYDENPEVRISYPDFIWEQGLYITETQKTIARVHKVPGELLAKLWE